MNLPEPELEEVKFVMRAEIARRGGGGMTTEMEEEPAKRRKRDLEDQNCMIRLGSE